MDKLSKFGIVDGSTLGNPTTGNFYEFYDSSNSYALTRRDSLGVDVTYLDIGTPLVQSFNGRGGTVVAELGDYDASEVTNAFDKATDSADDIDDSTSTNKFATAAELSGIAVNTLKVSADLSIDTHSDVDTTTLAPTTNKSLLSWDGFNWVPYVKGYILLDSSDTSQWVAGQTTEGLINNTTTPQAYLTITGFLAKRAGFYEVHADLTHSYDIGTSNMIMSYELATSQGAFQTFDFYHEEPQDTAGTGQVLNTIAGGVIGASVNSGTDMRLTTSVRRFIQTSIPNVTIDFKILFKCEVANSRAAIYRGHLTIEEKIKS